MFKTAARRPGGAHRRRRSSTGTPGPRAWPTTRARRSRTRGGTTSSSRASLARRTTRASTGSRWRRRRRLQEEQREGAAPRACSSVGMKIGPDGALYLTDWITGWDSKNNGRLWKLDTPAAAGSGDRKEVQELLLRRLRRSGPPRQVAALLRHRRHARAAEGAVRSRPPRRRRRRSLAAARDRAHLHRAPPRPLGRRAARAPRSAHTRPSSSPFLADGDAEMRAQAARLIGDVKHAGASERLLPLLEDAAPRVRFFAAEALGRVGLNRRGAALVEMLAANDGRDPMAAAHRQPARSPPLATRAALEALATHTSARRPQRRRRRAAPAAPCRRRAVPRRRRRARRHRRRPRDQRRWRRLPAAVPQLAARAGDRVTVTNEPLVRRALNANLRLGTAGGRCARRGLRAQRATPSELRVEAMAALGVWGDPSPMDRVDGFYHGSYGRDRVGSRESGSVERTRRGLVAAGRRRGARARRQRAASSDWSAKDEDTTRCRREGRARRSRRPARGQGRGAGAAGAVAGRTPR